jgi:glycerol-3-phosphate dehydrogenase (NAD(P)+)
MATLTVVGAGMMGGAFCLPLVDRGHEVRLVGTPLDEEIIASLRRDGTHPKMKLALPAQVRPYAHGELDAALAGADMVVLGVSSAGVDWALEVVGPKLEAGKPLLMVTKGLLFQGGRLRALPDVIAEGLPERLRGKVPTIAVTGPCIAGELARRVETCVVFAGRDGDALERAAAMVRAPYYHVWTSTDVEGPCACAALKNAYAMGVAFAAGAHERSGGAAGSIAMHNYEAATFAQAAFEMRRVLEAMGADASAAGWLPGVGDLHVTGNGGRTGRFGRLLGLGLTASEARAKMAGDTLECCEILAVMREALPVLEASGRLGADELPLLRHMAALVLDDVPLAMPFDRFFMARGGSSQAGATGGASPGGSSRGPGALAWRRGAA